MALLIQKEGILTTVQGLERYGMQRFGINPGGAMDSTATRLINLLLGNEEWEPVIEMHFPASEIVFEEACVIALGGADLDASLNGESIENWRPIFASRSSVLKFKQKVRGNRCYLSAKGGFNLDRLYDHGGTEFRKKILKSPQLKKHSRLDLKIRSTSVDAVPERRISTSLLPVYSQFPTVRIVAGGEFNLLDNAGKRILSDETFTVTNDSNRMGYRLRGHAIHPTKKPEMVSSAVSFGTIQLLPDGQLIVLMADHQTSGGYPRIANVISSDLPLLAQLAANDKVAFKLIDIEEAERISIRFEHDVQRLRIGCSFGRYWP